MSLKKVEIIELLTQTNAEELYQRADKIRHENVGDEVHLRGLIEFSNICRNNCLYCGIRKGNAQVVRYHMSEEELIETARKAANIGFKTIVMQSGEDMWFSRDKMCHIVEEIKKFESHLLKKILQILFAQIRIPALGAVLLLDRPSGLHQLSFDLSRTVVDDA